MTVKMLTLSITIRLCRFAFFQIICRSRKQNAAFSYIVLRLTYTRGLILELGRCFSIASCMRQYIGSSGYLDCFCGRPWPAAYINFNQNIHQIQVLTKPLCRAQAIFYSLPNNEWGTKYLGLTYSAK